MLLDRPPPPGYRAEWARHLAAARARARALPASAFVFRLAEEWLALPTAQFHEAAPLRPVHSIPGRRAGLVDVRGELVPFVPLVTFLGIHSAPTPPAASSIHGATTARLLVAGPRTRRIAFTADEVHGVLRHDPAAAQPAPARLAHVRHLLPWRNQTVGLLDPETLWPALDQSLA